MIDEQDDHLEVQIIDFGLCDKIMKDGEHVEMKQDGPRGTYIYMSRAAMEGKTLSRRDDWESLCYVIYALVNGALPWQSEQDLQKMLKMKQVFA